MSLLRILASLADPPLRCQWALLGDDGEVTEGDGPLAELPRRVGRVQLLFPASQVLLARARLPATARRDGGSLLAFAVEEQSAADPDANQLSWLGAAGEDDVLAVYDKAGLARWRLALAELGLRDFELYCETLMLPRASGEWSLAWNGHDGFVRCAALEGAATDCGDALTPPLALQLLLEQAQLHGGLPDAIAVLASPAATPDLAAWTQALGVPLRPAAAWDWRRAPADAGVRLGREQQRWHMFAGLAARLRPAAWILGAALAIHAIALVIDWSVLASEQRALRQQMEARFRSVFPDAVAVADPALQMRRKLAEARHATGQSDPGDFLPMLGQVAQALKVLPAGAVRVLSYEGGRVTLELAAPDPAILRQVNARLLQSGLTVDSAAGSGESGAATVVLTVRSS